EMATGERPFKGRSLPEITSSILRDTPVPVVEKRRDLPGPLGRIVRRCLEKDPRRRYQSALDVRNDLEELLTESVSVLQTPGAVPPGDWPARPTGSPSSADAGRGEPDAGSRRPWIYAAGAVAALVMIGAAISLVLRGGGREPLDARATAGDAG